MAVAASRTPSSRGGLDGEELPGRLRAYGQAV